ncbi:hypothetical protein DE4585_01637 [Mycobacteroides salmoniphilum]|uniref:Uncharacterized protein n=1 Tax=Mycobacteroides salmoniphilum TaxID=404941 RepID=A0A4R8S178_9MYCO|nr:hypothetical protein DE4585_01637 [Mycobacteroides salmoniphilum]
MVMVQKLICGGSTPGVATMGSLDLSCWGYRPNVRIDDLIRNPAVGRDSVTIAPRPVTNGLASAAVDDRASSLAVMFQQLCPSGSPYPYR